MGAGDIMWLGQARNSWLQTPPVVVLPDEPYQFNQADGPEAFPGMPCALVSGRFLTWYGPAMVEAPQGLLAPLRSALA